MSDSTQARRVFDAALEAPPDQRDALVEQLCGDDAALRREVSSLLSALESAGERLESARVEGLDPAEPSQPRQPLSPGARIGPYEVLEQIGKGGTSEVYRARQSEPFVRDVALKVLSRRAEDLGLAQRFEVEQQTLALLDHPSVATVFDAGITSGGQPYFVMERIDGVRLNDDCAQHQLDLSARLALFEQVCAAVHHCHTRGIVHCDLKPANILVTRIDAEPLVKIIDFGIAHVLRPTHAGTGRRIPMGTPPYVAPEQLEQTETLDSRSDVYALGVLLGELIEPVRHQISEVRRRELQWLLDRATGAAPEQRYASVAHLAGDLDAWKHNRPLAAGPGGIGYPLRKWARRNRAVGLGLVAGALLTVALLIGLSWGWYQSRQRADLAGQLQRIEQERRQAAEADATRSRESLGLTLEMIAELDPWVVGRSVDGAESLLDLIANRTDGVFRDDPNREASIQAALGAALTSTGAFARAEPLLRDALEHWTPSGPPSFEVYDAEWALADAVAWLERPDAAVQLERARTSRAQLVARANPVLGQMVQRLHAALGDEATEAPRDLLTRLLARSARLPLEAPLRWLIVDACSDAAFALAGRMDDPTEVLLQTVDAQRALYGEDHPDPLMTMSLLGDSYNRLGQAKLALPLLQRVRSGFERVLPGTHPELHVVEARLAESWLALGDNDAARARLADAEAGLRAAGLGDTASGLHATAQLVRLAEQSGDATDAAERLLAQVVERPLLPESRVVVWALPPGLRAALRDSGDMTELERALTQATVSERVLFGRLLIRAAREARLNPCSPAARRALVILEGHPSFVGGIDVSDCP